MKQLCLVVMDGWGVGQRWGGNAIYNAQPSFYGSLWQTVPSTTLGASGLDVGLLAQTSGNSEAGHVNIGAGRVVSQDLSWIQHQIDSGDFFKNKTLNEIFSSAKQTGKPVHIIGLLSDGGIHAHIDHMYALLELAARYRPVAVYLHLFGDGRDTEPHRIQLLLERLTMRINKFGVGIVASIVGRYYAMDRARNFDRTQKAFSLLTAGTGEIVSSWEEGIANAYRRGMTDEYLSPMALRQTVSQTRIKDGDFIIFTNFRADRIWQIEAALTENNFSAFARQPIKPGRMVSFVPIETAPNLESAMAPPTVSATLGEVISLAGFKQLRIAETEKGPHATYFLNGGRKEPFSGQKDEIVPSPTQSYVTMPEMSAYKLEPLVLRAIGDPQYKFIFLNLANADMVGHTGNMEASIKAVRIVDSIIKKITGKAIASGTSLIVTADHGNIDEMISPATGDVSVDHTRNRVPLFLITDDKRKKLRENGRLCDIAPTALSLMGLEKPPVMNGQSLVV